jgi:hypothetical protein
MAWQPLEHMLIGVEQQAIRRPNDLVEGAQSIFPELDGSEKVSPSDDSSQRTIWSRADICPNMRSASERIRSGRIRNQ